MLEILLLKLKNSLISNSHIFLIALGVVIIFSSFWVFETYTKDVYEEREELISSYTQHGKYTYTASVTKNNPLYPKGTALEMGKAAYFFTVSPTLDVSFAYNLNATDSADLHVECETVILATSMDGSRKILWEKEFPVKDMGYIGVSNKDVLIHEFSLNVPEIQSKVKEVENELKYSSGASIKVVTRVNYEGEINGEEIDSTTDFILPLSINSAYYQIPGELEFSENTDTYKKYLVKKDPSFSVIKLPLSLFLFSMILVGMLYPCTKMSAVDSEYIKKLEKEYRYSPFKEFISKGKVPENLNSLIKVEISSLQDLVNAAVDMNARVVNDTESDAYFIIHDNTLYIFSDVPLESSSNNN